MERTETASVKIEANIPLPLYKALELVHDTLGTSWDELFTNAVRCELSCMETDNLESETEPMRLELTRKICEYLEEARS